MTLPEFFGCAFLAFGPPLALFTMTIAQDPIRIIILVVAAFLWLCSLLLSSFIWFILVPLRDLTIFGMIISIIIQVYYTNIKYFLQLLKKIKTNRILSTLIVKFYTELLYSQIHSMANLFCRRRSDMESIEYYVRPKMDCN